jgi:lysophospholipase L1-like esterase
MMKRTGFDIIAKRLLAFLACSFGLLSGLSAQETAVDTSYANSYYLYKRSMHESVRVHSWNVVFMGNSITERGLWGEWFPEIPVLNRGIGGDNCWGVDARLGTLLEAKPTVIFFLIGINDLGRGLPPDLISTKYEQIICRIKNESRNTRLVLHTVLPINETNITFEYMKGKTPKILELNKRIRQLAKEYNVKLIDLHQVFADGQNQMPDKLVIDGLHLNNAGYQLWIKTLNESGILR